jgi:Integrase zinc binding domain
VDPIHSTRGSLNLYNDPSKPHNFISKGSINAMVIVNSETIDQLPSQYADDPDFSSLFANPTGSYRVKEGRLFKDNILCVPRGPLRDTILHYHHDAAVSGHRGFAKTLSSIRLSYFWPALRKYAEGYVKSCDACQRAKALRQPRGGIIRPFPPPMKKWEVISMDFVFDLPVTSSGKSGIAVIVDKLSRQAHFLSLPPKFDAVDLAHLYLHEVYRHLGLPRVLISDRDVRFTSLFWTALVAPWILFATLWGNMDGKCIYCSDRSAGAPTLTVSWTLLPSFYWFFVCSFSFSCCQYLVLDVIPLFNVDCHRLRSGRVA